MTPDIPRILMIDDDEGLRELVQRRLQKNRCLVSTAGTLAEARRFLKDSAFDLLVIDYKLAENMTGLDFYDELRTQGSTVPAILCSGFSDESRMEEARDHGITYILPKTPDYLDELADMVRQVLSTSRAQT